jgi:hypothetical protein
LDIAQFSGEVQLNENGNSPIEKRLRKALEVHGFPLEILTHQKLLARKWTSAAESAYADSDTGKRRTVDFVAWKIQKTDAQFTAVDITLVIECKKRQNSVWVFYGEFSDDNEEFEVREILNMATFAVISANPEVMDRWHDSAIMKVFGSSHQLIDSDQKVAISGHEIRLSSKKPKEEDRDYLHDACNAVTKAVDDKYKKMAEDWGESIPETLQFIYPVIVFEGPMYWATSSKGKIDLQEVQYVQLEWETRQDQRIIDVVNASSLDVFLDMMDKELVETASGVNEIKGWFEIVGGKIRQILRVDKSSKEKKKINNSSDKLPSGSRNKNQNDIK